MYSKNLLGSANSLWRECPGRAKNPTSYVAASRTKSVIGTGRANRTRSCKPSAAMRSRKAGLNAGFSGPRIVSVNSGRHCSTLSIGLFETAVRHDDTVVEDLDPVAPRRPEHYLLIVWRIADGEGRARQLVKRVEPLGYS